MKILILCLLTGVVISLGFALRGMTNGSRQQTVNALTLRVILAIGLRVVMLVSWKMGLIEPHA